jgi:hypothetical protein
MEAILYSLGPAVIGAIFALLVSWLTQRSRSKQRALEKEIKLSEYRQLWINQLRDTIADFGAITSVEGNWEKNKEKVIGLVFKIEMMMNPDDPDYKNLRAALKYRADSQVKSGMPDYDNLLKVSQDILKREWDRLKSDLENSKL